MVLTQGGSVLHVCTKFEVDRSIRSKVISRSQNLEIGPRDPGHAHLGVVLYSTRRRGPYSISVPNMKRIAQFIQKLLRGPEIRKLGHVTPATPTYWSFYGPYANLKRIALFVQKLLGGPKFRFAADPLLRGAGRPKFNQLEMVTTFTYRPSLVGIDARNIELSW